MEFKWLNESKVIKEGNKIEVFATPNSDFFYSSTTAGDEGITPESLCNAPFYYTEIKGDFVMRAKVSHAFKSVYDSSSLMVYKNDACWAKACFEYTDFGTHAVVSVVTNGESDDANGCNITQEKIWLQVCRAGNAFAFHYSLDGENFYMMRYFHLPVEETVKVGMLAQSPTGQGGVRVYEDFVIENKTVKNLRMGK